MGRAGYVFPYGVVPDMCWLLGGEILACVLHFSRLICKTKPHEAKPKQDLYLGDVLQQVIPEESHGAGSAWRFGAVAASTEERPWGLWQCGKVAVWAWELFGPGAQPGVSDTDYFTNHKRKTRKRGDGKGRMVARLH